MPTVSKNFSFLSDLDSWFQESSTSTTTVWDSSNGIPSGCMECIFSGVYSNPSTPDDVMEVQGPSGVVVPSSGSVGTNETSYRYWSGPWTALGVPSGTTVDSISLNSAYVSFYSQGSGSNSQTYGPWELQDNNYENTTTLLGQLPFQFGDYTWTPVSGTTQSVPLAIMPSISDIKLGLGTHFTYDGSMPIIGLFDEIQYTITYHFPPSNGSGILSNHPSFAASGSVAVPIYHGHLASTSTHPVFLSGATNALPAYHGTVSWTVNHPLFSSSATDPHDGSAYFSKHPTYSCSGSQSVPTQASLVTKGWGYGQRTLTRYYVGFIGCVANLIADNAQFTATATCPLPDGSCVLVTSKSIIASGSFGGMSYYGPTSLSKHPTLISNASFFNGVDILYYTQTITTDITMTRTIVTQGANMTIYVYGGSVCQFNAMFS